jgi:hypothetical protein
MPTAALYRGSYGLSNRVPPELIPFNAETGVTGLQRADNVLIGEAGQLYCRQGSRQVFAGSCHSEYPVPGGFLFVEERVDGAFLSLALEDQDGSLSVSEIAQLGHSGNWLSWFELAGEYWYSTEKERGIVSRDYIHRDWPNSEQYEKDYSDIPMDTLPYGRHACINGVHVLSARGTEIYKSEPLQPSIYALDDGQFSAAGAVRMLLPVQAGFYYSDDMAIWFVAGLDPKKFTARKVLDYPAIEYCHIYGLVNASDVGLDSYSLGVVFMTVQGPVFGFPDGTVINLTDKQYAMPDCAAHTRGSMMMVNRSMLIISLS